MMLKLSVTNINFVTVTVDLKSKYQAISGDILKGKTFFLRFLFFYEKESDLAENGVNNS